MKGRKLFLLAVIASIAACSDQPTAPPDSDPAPPPVPPPPPAPPPAPVPVPSRAPLTEIGINTYKGFQGGLYDGGVNDPPAAHAAAGIAIRNTIRPLDADGNPSASGRIVLISVGMSNTTQEFCSGSSTTTQCNSYTFMGQAAADAQVNRTTLTIVNGARGMQVATAWDDPADEQYDTVRVNRLQRVGLTERQVQIAWVKVANPGPRDSLPAANADAYQLERTLGRIVRALKVRYPNLKMVFLSSRIYAGYATVTLNPEPYAFENGFSVRWLIDAQIRQIANGTVDAESGSLDYRTGEAPWVAWGPYLWANGATPRQGDGLFWLPADMQQDGTHPSPDGMRKVGDQLLAFFKGSTFTQCWFLAGRTCQ